MLTIEQHMDGTLKAGNGKEGAEFIIELPIYKTLTH